MQISLKKNMKKNVHSQVIQSFLYKKSQKITKSYFKQDTFARGKIKQGVTFNLSHKSIKFCDSCVILIVGFCPWLDLY